MNSVRPPLRTKICGLTCPADAVAAVIAGPDAVGLNFFPKSKRFVTAAAAAEIAAVIPPRILAVGVFVNAAPDAIAALCESAPLRGIQLHGEETPEQLAAVAEIARQSDGLVIKALATSEMSDDRLVEYLAECQRLRALPDVILLDAAIGAAAGQGEVADWNRAGQLTERIRNFSMKHNSKPPIGVLLAGGLNPKNVESAIQAVRPDGVDVASGVEASPGSKDPCQMEDFVTAAKRAFDGSDG